MHTLHTNYHPPVPGFIGAVADGLSEVLTMCYAAENAAARALSGPCTFSSISTRADENDGTFTIHIIGAETEGMQVNGL
jgi:hypothetical protein